MTRIHALALLAALTGSLLVGCTGGDPAEQTFRPTLIWGPCPEDVEVQFVSKHECGTLKVLADHDDTAGPSIDLFVVKVWPVGVGTTNDAGLGFGANFGDPPSDGGGIAAGATRLRGIFYGLEYRGTGSHGSASLRCPEVEALGTDQAGKPDDDPGSRADFVGAVSACAARLRADGVEPADYDTENTIADVEDLRLALGVGRWTAGGSYGTMSALLDRALALSPDSLPPFVFEDSPAPPGLDPLTAGALGTRSALDELFRSCTTQADCSSRYPHLAASWQRALDRLATTPLTGKSGDTEVYVDDSKLLRVARFTLGGDGPSNLTFLPRVITRAAAGRLDPKLAEWVADDVGFCAGYRPLCIAPATFALGVFMTDFCGHAVDEAALAAAVGDDRAYSKVFQMAPYRAACEAWHVPTQPDPPVPTGVPMLLLPGQFDSWSRPEWAAERVGGTVFSVTIPANTHNTLGFNECVLTLRAAWVAAPTKPPNGHACDELPPLPFR